MEQILSYVTIETCYRNGEWFSHNERYASMNEACAVIAEARTIRGMRGWKYCAVPHYHSPELSRAIVEARETITHQPVIDAIVKRHGDEAIEILPTVRHYGSYYGFVRWGMFVGIEYDGYMHT
jgi:hypothetical protein